MTVEDVFDSFLRDRLGFLKGNYDRFEFQDLKPVIGHASELGFFNFDETDAPLSLVCSFLKKSARVDGGFAMTVFIQALCRSLFQQAKTEKPFDLIAFSPFQKTSDLTFTRDGGKYFIHGTAKAVALAKESSHLLLAASSADASCSLFTVKPTQTLEPILTIGLRTLPLYDVVLKSAEASLIGHEGSGELYFSQMAREMRVAASAMMLGILDGAYQEALSYGHERIQGGRKIIEWSEHQMVLAQIFSRLKVCESLLAHCLSQGEALTEVQSLSTFIHFQECLAEMTSACVQAMGGAGYMKDYPLERYYRDAHQLRCLFGAAPFHQLDLFKREGMNV